MAELRRAVFSTQVRPRRVCLHFGSQSWATCASSDPQFAGEKASQGGPKRSPANEGHAPEISSFPSQISRSNGKKHSLRVEPHDPKARLVQ